MKRIFVVLVQALSFPLTPIVFAQNFWEPASGSGSSFYALAISPNGYIFAGTLHEGILRSMDNGDSWMQVNSGLTNHRVNSFAINVSGHIFAGTSSGIFRSTNNGNSWVPVNKGLNGSVAALAINASGHIFAGTNGDIFRSTNNGESWVPVNNGLPPHNSRGDIAINASGHIFAGTAGDIFRSTNNGDRWTNVNSGRLNFGVTSLTINTNGHIFAGSFYSQGLGAAVY